jgi:hypothetical protein
MIIPSKLKVGGLTYAVEIVDRIDEPDCAAYIDTQLLQIKIARAPKEAMLHNFIHEMVHAINPEIPEETTEYLSSMLHQVIVDNPGAFKGGVEKNG